MSCGTLLWLAQMAGLSLMGGLAATAAGSPMVTVSANDPAILYEGRFAPGAQGAVRLGFPGVSAHLRLRGSALTLRATATEVIYFDVAVDGAAPALLQLHQGEGAYALIPPGPAVEHTVTLTRRNESWQGTCELLAFAVDGGGLSRPLPLPARKIMFIGDSVTGGEMDAYEIGRDFHDRLNSNARVSYGMILARHLGAQCALVSYGGRGLLRDWQGVRATSNAPQFYELALPDDPTAKWDHQRYIPDAIGIALGQNDFNTGIPDQVEYVNAYVEFIAKIRRDAPHATIFLINSPMQGDGDPRRKVLLAYLAEVVARCASPKVLLAPLSNYPGVPGNSHPTGAEHEKMAAELEPVIRRALDW